MGFFDAVIPYEVSAVREAGHGGVHNFCVGTLTAYFGLGTAAATMEDGILHLTGLKGGSRMKVFVFDALAAAAAQARLPQLQQQTVIYSKKPLSLPKGSAFKEIAYNLPRVLDPASYPNAKKRAQRLRYPASRFQSERISIRKLGPKDLAEATVLHSSWCAWKLADPATFQMMFPRRRYINCVEVALQHPAEYACYGAYREEAFGQERLLGVRVLYVEKAFAFDLANFAATFDPSLYNAFAEHFALMTMAELHSEGVDLLNCGASLNKQLSAFKSHWPHFDVLSYAYGRTAA